MAKIDLTDRRTLERVVETAARCVEKMDDYAEAKALFFREHEGAIEKKDIQDMERIFHRTYKSVKQ